MRAGNGNTGEKLQTRLTSSPLSCFRPLRRTGREHLLQNKIHRVLFVSIIPRKHPPFIKTFRSNHQNGEAENGKVRSRNRSLQQSRGISSPGEKLEQRQTRGIQGPQNLRCGKCRLRLREAVCGLRRQPQASSPVSEISRPEGKAHSSLPRRGMSRSPGEEAERSFCSSPSFLSGIFCFQQSLSLSFSPPVFLLFSWHAGDLSGRTGLAEDEQGGFSPFRFFSDFLQIFSLDFFFGFILADAFSAVMLLRIFSCAFFEGTACVLREGGLLL